MIEICSFVLLLGECSLVFLVDVFVSVEVLSSPLFRHGNQSGTGHLAGDFADAPPVAALAKVSGVVLLLGGEGLGRQRLLRFAECLDESRNDLRVGLRVHVEINLFSCNS